MTWKSQRFFETYFEAAVNTGYHNPRTDFRSCFPFFDDGAKLEIMNKTNMDDPETALARTGFIHLAFSLGSKEKVDALTRRLKDDGFEVVSGPRITGDGYIMKAVLLPSRATKSKLQSE